MNWDTQGGTLSREQAIANIKDMAKDEGIHGSFKVFYNGSLISNPEDLPDQVDMRGIRVSAVLDNA